MKTDFTNVNISFAGCGFMCIYHAGVSAALKEYAPEMIKNRIYGASAGAIAAASLLCNVCISEATSAILQVICEARSGFLQVLSPTFDLLGLARDGMEKIFPENAHILCSNRLHISLTRYDDCKNVTISNFSSKEDLIQAILCSCFIPAFCGLDVPKFHGVRYIDGGFSDNQPRFNDKTITISPFSGESDICPMDFDSASIFEINFHNTSFRLTTNNLYRLCSCFAPPPQDICSMWCRQGFTDALRFLTKNGITPCVKCLTIQSNALPLPTYETQFKNSNIRKRYESECEICLEKLNSSVDFEQTRALFPEHMKRTLDDTKPKGKRIYNYLKTYRIFKWLFSIFSQILYYWLMILNLTNSILNVSSKKNFFSQKLQVLINLIFKEIENKIFLNWFKFPYYFNTNDKVDVCANNGNDIFEFFFSKDYCKNNKKEINADSCLSLIEYAKNHSAILAFHYLNSSNKVKVCEIFDVNRQEPNVKCHTTIKNKTVSNFEKNDLFKITPVKEEKEFNELLEEQTV